MSQSIKKRRMVDIYFVLYLAALVFLLPSPKDKITPVENDNNNVVDQPFFLYPEKTSLLCTVTLENNVPKIISLDSINTIYYSGQVEDVFYEFLVIDKISNERLVLSSDNIESGYFRIEEKSFQRSAEFIWKPSLSNLSNKTYNVEIIATAKTKGLTGDETTTLRAKTKFSVNLIYLNPVINPIDSQSIAGLNQVDSIRNSGFQTNVPAEVLLQIPNPLIESFANEKWNAKVFLNGFITRDVQTILPLKIIREPENNGGSAEISDVTNSIFTISGRTPYAGKMKVEIALVRKLDRKTVSVQIVISPKTIKPPQYEKEMYPEIKYTIKPNLPFIQGQDIKAILREQSRERVVVQDGAPFDFVPEASDTGKAFILERYINNTLRDKYTIYVRNFPDPQIVRIGSEERRKVKLETRSFGFFMGRENFIKLLEIDGNARYYQKFGSNQDNKSNYSFTQIWEIIPKNPDEPFKFKVRAIDQRGRKSNDEYFSE